MTAAAILNELKDAGVALWAEGGKLRYRGPKGALTEKLRASLLERKDEILALVDPHAAIPRIPDQPSYPLSHSQRRLWILSQLEEGSAAYNVPLHQLLEGRLDRNALERAFATLTARHESLRTTFTTADGEPRQAIHPPPTKVLEFLDYSERGLAAALELGRRDAVQPFDLERGPLLRATLIQTAPAVSVLLVTLHHIICDGVSIAVLGRELSALYQAFSRGRPDPLPPLRIHYRDFAHWQNAALSGPAAEDDRAYWKRKLRPPHPALDLPTDFPRPPTQSFRGAETSLHVSVERLRALQALARKQNSSVFIVLVSLVKALLHRYTGQRDIVVGSPFAGRNHADLEGQIGFFLNMLPLRDEAEPNLPFEKLLERVRRTATEAFDRQSYPFDLLVNEVGASRELARSPLFDVVVILQSQKDEGLQFEGLSARSCFEHPGTSKFDLTFTFKETAAGLILSIEYATALFEPARIQRMGAHFERLIDAVATDPQSPIARLDILPEEERRLVCERFQGPAAPPRSRTVVEMFAEQAEQTPEAIAIVATDAASRPWTYRDLDRAAEAAARRLGGAGCGPERRVALLLDRSPLLIAGLLGALKAGAAYVPLDPSQPAERLRGMLDDAEPHAILTTQELRPLAGERFQSAIIDIHEACTAPAGPPSRGPLSQESLAYLIYTSGSTGKPKGVAVSHRSLTNFLLAMQRSPGLAADDVLLAVTTVSFDIAALELLLPLICGAQIVLADRFVAADGEALLAAARAHRTTVLQATPATWKLLLAAGWDGDPPLRAWCGGEALRADLAADLGARASELWNLYGPTETTIWSAARRAAPDSRRDDPEPVGGAIAATELYALDARLQPAPLGVTGGLFIGGDGLARGYYNNPRLTAEKFLPDPFSGRPGSRLYETGDLVRMREDGLLTFLGRADNQIKLRGFRIEAGEIEAQLAQHPAVKEAVVLADAVSEARLLAYFLPAYGAVPSLELERWLRERLPDYMIPAVFLPLERFPLTPNGKIDRRAFPQPEPQRTPAAPAESPRTPSEEILCGIWAETLGRERIDPESNFFESGGHSLLAMQMLARVRKTFRVELPLRKVFEAPTVRELARALEAAGGRSVASAGGLGRESGPAPLSFAQQRIWFEQLRSGDSAYNLSAALRVRGELNVEALLGSLREIARRHEILRSLFEERNGRPVQFAAEQEFTPSFVDFSGLSEEAVRRAAFDEANRPFDLARELPFRATVLRLADADHALLLSVHHIAADEWAVHLIVRELTDLYAARVQGQSEPPPEPTWQYADYARWEQRSMDGERINRSVEHWNRLLEEAPTDLGLPAARSNQDSAAGRFAFNIDPATSQALLTLGRQRDATAFMTFLAVYAILLSRYAGRNRVVIGAPISHRDRVELEGIVGCFVNALALRIDLPAGLSFREFLGEVRDRVLEAHEYKDAPFEQVLASLGPDRRNAPLVQTVFTLQEADPSELRLGDAAVELLPSAATAAKFDIALSVSASSDGFRGEFEYRRSLFDDEAVRRLAGHFVELCNSAVREPDKPADLLPLLTAAEQRDLAAWNCTEAVFPRDRTLNELFEEQVDRRPEALAVDSPTLQVSYRELDERASRLARLLLEKGLQTEDRVGLCLEDSVDMTVCALAVVRAGGAYLALSPEYPEARLEFMIRDAAVRCILSREALLAKLPATTPALLLDRDRAEIERQSPTRPKAGASPGALALLVYTSGSTGRPKGIAISHAAVIRLAAGGDAFQAAPADRMGQAANFAFDLFTLELWGALANGACLVPIEREAVLSPGRLTAAIRERNVSSLFLTTALFHEIVRQQPAAFERLRWLGFGGETAEPRWAREALLAGAPESMVHLYGPAENTTLTTFYRVTEPPDPETPLPIGGPLNNTRVYILDRRWNPLPVGIPGELAIAGDGLARGYWGQPALTAARFVPDPLHPLPGARMYLTGDRARRLPGGAIEFLGRFDDQVKIRGFRIEPREAEAAIEEFPGVEHAVVLIQGATSSDKSLAAYVVRSRQAAFGADELRAFLHSKLPGYMIPSGFAFLERLPLTPNGKLDRAALLQAPLTSAPRKTRPPRDAVERVVAGLYQRVLQVDSVAAEDDFFELGGHSLLATQLLSRIQSVFRVELPIAEFFRASSPAEVANRLRSTEAAAGNALKIAQAYERLQALTPEQKREMLEAKRARQIASAER